MLAVPTPSSPYGTPPFTSRVPSGAPIFTALIESLSPITRMTQAVVQVWVLLLANSLGTGTYLPLHPQIPRRSFHPGKYGGELSPAPFHPAAPSGLTRDDFTLLKGLCETIHFLLS